MKSTYGEDFLKELEMEEMATRKCLERIPADLFDWKPHDKSMKMGDLAAVITEIPGWIVSIAESGSIDFAIYKPFNPKSTSDLMAEFDKNMKKARQALGKISDKEMEETFSLKQGGKVLDSSSKKESIGSSINHLAHHRGQLTVYMRLNNIMVPSIYGPSADENVWM